MPSPSDIFTELVATTYRSQASKVVDNISLNNALFAIMQKRDKKRKVSGGVSIATTLDYAANGTYQRYSGYDVLNIQPSEVLTAAQFPWRQISISTVASGLEMRTNSGKEAFIDLVKARTTNALRTFTNNFSADMYSDGTLMNQIGGLQALVSDTGVGTVGGIDATLWPFWQNKVQSAAAPMQGGGAIVVGPTTIESLMLPLWLSLIRGGDQPNLIVADNNYYSIYEQSQTSLKRYTNANEVSGGFTSLKYKNADMVFDGVSGIPLNRMYFLNPDYFNLVVHPEADMVVLDKVRPVNQDAAVVPMLWMGNMEITNRALQGVMRP